jgi:hypothetical protein
MLNEVHVEGFVVTQVREFQGTRYVRIASRYDPGRGIRDGNDAAYITLRVDPPLAAVASTLRTGQAIRASGYIISRDYGITLARFAEAAVADGDGADVAGALEELRALARRVGDKIQKPHTMTEVQVESLMIL